jgi:hypothetical protein
MSRGLGNLQRLLYWAIKDARYERPMTYAQIRMLIVEGGSEPWPSLDRAARRALAGLVRRKQVLALGPGGVQRPHRYCLHPGELLGENDGIALQVLSDFQSEMREAGTPICIESIAWAMDRLRSKEEAASAPHQHVAAG